VNAAASASPAWTASCAAGASTSASGCGSWDAAPSSGQAPGFLAGQQSQPNLIDVNQDGWSGSQGAQSISASTYQNWSVTATDTPPQANSAQILTYPDTSFNYYQLNAAPNYTDPPSGYDLNNISSLTSSYSETMPATSDKYTAEAAYDIWLNNWDTEVMVWTDVHYQGVDCGGPGWTPECSGDTLLGNYTYDGQQWSLYDNGGGINGYYMWIPDNGTALDAVSQPSGTVDLKDMLAQTATSGKFTADSPLTSIDYGWEIADTGGKPLTFTMNSLSVSINGSTTPPPAPTTTPTTPAPTTPPPSTPPPTPSSATIYACAAKSGAISKLNDTTAPTCASGSTPISWSAQEG
jgi:hypothetical protein